MMKVSVELLQDNRLIGTHVHSKGDVVEMDRDKANEWVKRGYAAITNKPVTELPKPAPRFPANNFPVTRTASNPEAAAALRAAEERDARKPAGKRVPA
jgi:hypothetical protein